MCIIDSEVFAGQQAPLFAGKQQHWVLAFPDSGVDDELRVMFFRNRYLTDLRIDLDDIVITGRQVGRPSAIQGKQKKRVAQHVDINPDEWLPEDTVYLSVAFDLESAPSTIPWPWDYDDCPEDLTNAGGLYSVYAPAQIVRIPESDPLGDTIDDIGDDIDDAAETAKDAAEKALTPLSVGVGLGLVGIAYWLAKR